MKLRKIPQRKCVTCQKTLTKKEMIRIVRTPEGEVALDLTSKKNGRGAYVCGRYEGFVKARKSKALERALKISIPPEKYDELDQQFLQWKDKYTDVKCENNQ